MMATGCRLGLRVLVCIDIASFARYAGLYGGVLRLPTARGLAVGYTLSPATRACTEACFAYLSSDDLQLRAYNWFNRPYRNPKF